MELLQGLFLLSSRDLILALIDLGQKRSADADLDSWINPKAYEAVGGDVHKRLQALMSVAKPKKAAAKKAAGKKTAQPAGQQETLKQSASAKRTAAQASASAQSASVQASAAPTPTAAESAAAEPTAAESPVTAPVVTAKPQTAGGVVAAAPEAGADGAGVRATPNVRCKVAVDFSEVEGGAEIPQQAHALVKAFA